MEIQTSTFDPNSLHGEQVHQIYNGLDCCLTVEINRELKLIKNEGLPLHYSFHKALQAPILEIMLRGFKVDTAARAEALSVLRTERQFLYLNLQKLALACQPDNLNPNSTVQLQKLFYGVMGIPEIWTSSKGKRTLSMNRDTLEKLAPYFHARPFVAHILAIRERDKLIQMLETEINDDGRYRTSYNIAGTETGQLSSSSSIDGTGGNAQNLPPNVRKVFCADPGFRLYCIDLEQAESREVGWQCGLLFNDWTYLDACEGGDLHTLAAKLTWPDLKWTGKAKEDRAVADQTFYRDFSYRDMAKRGGHGCLTKDASVFTNKGIKSIANVTDTEQILIYNPKLKEFKFELPSAWVRKQYSGDLYEMNLCGSIFYMTPEHRIVYSTDGQWKECMVKDWHNCVDDAHIVTGRGLVIDVSIFGNMKLTKLTDQNLTVYCPTVSTGAFLVQSHKGGSHVTGNFELFRPTALNGPLPQSPHFSCFPLPRALLRGLPGYSPLAPTRRKHHSNNA